MSRVGPGTPGGRSRTTSPARRRRSRPRSSRRGSPGRSPSSARSRPGARCSISSNGSRERIAALQELAQRYPTLLPYLLLTGEGLRESAAAVIRSHDPSDAGLDTVLVLHACYGTLSTLFTGGLEIVPEGEPRVVGALTVAEFIDLAFSRLRTGFDSGPALTD